MKTILKVTFMTEDELFPLQKEVDFIPSVRLIIVNPLCGVISKVTYNFDVYTCELICDEGDVMKIYSKDYIDFLKQNGWTNQLNFKEPTSAI